MKNTFIFAFLLIFLLFSTNLTAQKKKKSTNSKLIFETKLYDGLHWRCIGPFRGGRSAAVTGVPGKPNLYYFGSTGGGVWRTTDAGNSWENISDGFFGGSIGAVAVSEWDNNVIYVGGGETTVRGNVSFGYGVWKSVDAGKTWKSMGLRNSRHIPRIRIHPKNPNLVYAAVLGDLYKSSDERGVYKSKDGGKKWEKILFANKDAGAIDLVLDPNNPRIIYASTWKVRRTPHSLESGGEGSALWKSTDGGDTWTNISKNKGLPGGVWGIVGVTVSPVNSDRVWAIIENKNGGVYRSDDAGITWKLVNSNRSLRQRAWYYTRIYADTKDIDIVYVMNVRYHRSKDGGKTFEAYNAPHGDHHDLWIAPENNNRMVIGDDGGAQVSFDAGQNWTTYYNQPTAQFYRVITDNHFPYRIYGAQQDNSTVRIAHRTDGRYIGERDWEPTAGGESAHFAVDPLNNDIVYGGSYGGFLTRVDHKTGKYRAINVWPDNPMGHGAEDFKYRFQWNFPIFFSPHNPKKLYVASNHLHVSMDEGQSWELISPDLTTNDLTKLKSSGGPITKDNTGVEYYCTIFAASESPYEKDLLWTGSDDGLVHMSRDGGKNWKNVTPKGMPEYIMINSIEPDPFIKGGAYIAGTRYKLGDYKPYLYRTKDYGKTWKLIVNGIGEEHFTRVLRADSKKQGLLYAGTESGMYVSFDNGDNWQSFQMNLPIVPVTDMTIKDNNLIVATQGRSFWMLDDISPLRELNKKIASSKAHLYKPAPSYRMNGRSAGISKYQGENHPGGVMFHFWIKDTTALDTVFLKIIDKDNQLIKTYSNKKIKDSKEKPFVIKPGLNRFVWDMMYPKAEDFEGMIMWWASLNGPKALPGKYKAELQMQEMSYKTDFEIVKDPRSNVTEEELREQFDFVKSLADKLTEVHKSIKKIRKVRKQVNEIEKRLKDTEYEDLKSEIAAILKDLKKIEEALYQTKNQSQQDPLNFPIRLNNKLGHLNSLAAIGDYKPTNQAKAFKKEIFKEINTELESLKVIFDSKIPKLNKRIKEQAVDLLLIMPE